MVALQFLSVKLLINEWGGVGANKPMIPKSSYLVKLVGTAMSAHRTLTENSLPRGVDPFCR